MKNSYLPSLKNSFKSKKQFCLKIPCIFILQLYCHIGPTLGPLLANLAQFGKEKNIKIRTAIKNCIINRRENPRNTAKQIYHILHSRVCIWNVYILRNIVQCKCFVFLWVVIIMSIFVDVGITFCVNEDNLPSYNVLNKKNLRYESMVPWYTDLLVV